MISDKKQTLALKFYSQRAIIIATIIGGPLAAGYLIRANYLRLGRPDAAIKALLLGIIATILIFASMFMIPESIIDKMPSILVPAVYTVITYQIVEKIQGDILKQQQDKPEIFYSKWRALGIGLVAMVILLASIFTFAYLAPVGDEYSKYDDKIAQFTANETETLTIYEHIDAESNSTILRELEESTIPKWQKNIELIKQAATIENLPPELIEQNAILLRYAELRLKSFELLKQSISEDTDIYERELAQTYIQIEQQVDKLKTK